MPRAWSLVSEGPAKALGLDDRGCIGDGLRADLILVDVQENRPPRIVATIINGDIAHLADSRRLN